MLMIDRIDFHAHILPGADHGSDSLKTSLQQLALAKSAGVQTVVATPHFYPDHDNLGSFLERREETSAVLINSHSEECPNVALGAEVHICAGLENMDGLEQLCIAGTNVILLELPFHRWSDAILDTVLTLQHSKKFTPVLAHVDRYLPEIIDLLFSHGMLGQLNAESVCKLMRRKRLLAWAQSGSIVALGSDIHGASGAYDKFRKAEKVLGETRRPIMLAAGKLLQGADFIL